MQKIKSPIFRKEFFFTAGESTLKGYFYPNTNSDKLIVLCHGFRSGADDFLPLINELVPLGYNLFAFDVTATYDSKGNSLIGACQWLVDLDNTLNFISQNDEFKKFKICLLGHSLGGYAVLSALSLHKEIYRVVALAPVNDAFTLMIDTARSKVGCVVQICKPFFDIFQKLFFGNYIKYNSIKGINSVDFPILIVQGKNDKVMKANKISVLSHKEEILNPNVVYYESEGLTGGHASLWHSEKGVKYKKKVDREYKVFKRKFKMTNREQKIKFFKGVNDYLYSQPNEELVKMIVQFFSFN